MYRPAVHLIALIVSSGLATMAETQERAVDPSREEPAAGSSPEDISSMLEPIRQKYDLPALAGSIVTRRGTLAIGASGHRARGVDDPVALDDRWHLGSCTKAMTSTLVARLVEEGRISWQTTIGEVLPEETNAQPAWQSVTIEHLLRLSSGLPADGTRWVAQMSEDELEGPMRARRRSVARTALARPPEAAPGDAVAYSNAGYVIAGSMLEVRMDAPWEDLIRQRLFEPLGMASAGFGPPRPLPQPQGHRKRIPVGVGEGADNPPVVGPAGTVHASLEDWGKFVALHLGAGTGGTEPLSRENLARMHSRTPTPGNDYAMGWITGTRDWGGQIITHSGTNLLWYSVVWAAPEQGFAVLVATNEGGEHANRGADEAAGALIRHYKAGASE